MPETQQASTKTLLELLAEMQSRLSTMTKHAARKPQLEAISARAGEINRRLHSPTAREWRAFVDQVENQPESGVWRFLFGDDSYSTDSLEFLKRMQAVVIAFAEGNI